MELALLLATFTMFWKFPAPASAQVRCYKCEPDILPTGVKANLCQYFDGDAKYLTECPASTMCYKKTVSMDFGGVKTIGITRGCAPQTLRDEQQKTNGKWFYTHTIHEVYEEKCSEDPYNDQKPTKTTHCYCRGDMCNSGSRIVVTTFLALSTFLSCIMQFYTGLS